MILTKKQPISKTKSLSFLPQTHFKPINPSNKTNSLGRNLESLLCKCEILTGQFDFQMKKASSFNSTNIEQSEQYLKQTAESTQQSQSPSESPQKSFLKSNHFIPENNFLPKIQDFMLGRKLGEGKFGDVYLCKHKASQMIYAIKIILKSQINKYKLSEQIKMEFNAMNKLNHPNIVKAYCKFEDQYHYFILMQYFPGSELTHLFGVSQSIVSPIIKQIIQAVMYLHRNGFAHRDIKPQNIIFWKGMIKICDFGWAADCKNILRNTFCGTYDYISPEILNGKMHSIEVDIWAIGVLTYELLTGTVPFKDIKYTKTIQSENIVFDQKVSDNAQKFILIFLLINPEDRASLHMALQHPFITNNTTTQLSIKINQSF